MHSVQWPQKVLCQVHQPWCTKYYLHCPFWPRPGKKSKKNRRRKGNILTWKHWNHHHHHHHHWNRFTTCCHLSDPSFGTMVALQDVDVPTPDGSCGRKPQKTHRIPSWYQPWAFFLVKFSGQKLIFLFGRITTFKKKIETKICCTKLELTFWESWWKFSKCKVWWTSRRNLEKGIPMADLIWCQKKIAISMIRRSQIANPNLWPFLRFGPSGMSSTPPYFRTPFTSDGYWIEVVLGQRSAAKQPLKRQIQNSRAASFFVQPGNVGPGTSRPRRPLWDNPHGQLPGTGMRSDGDGRSGRRDASPHRLTPPQAPWALPGRLHCLDCNSHVVGRHFDSGQTLIAISRKKMRGRSTRALEEAPRQLLPFHCHPWFKPAAVAA